MYFDNINKFLDSVSDFADNFQRKIDTFLTNIQSSIPKQFVRIHEKLNGRSWYITNSITLNGLIEIEEANDEEIDEIMIPYAREIINQTKERLLENYPNRADIIQQVFSAHKDKMYALSVPTMLILADGIGHEMFNVSIYSKERNSESPLTRKVVEKLESDNLQHSMLLYPLDILTSISLKISRVDEIRKENNYFGPLNRHRIIHGYSSDYHTEVNSLRCIVLLAYLLDIKENYF